MSSSEVIRLDRVTKTYRTGIGRARVREMMPPPIDRVVARAFPKWWRRNTFNAVEDVSLSLESGTSVGFVGHNGAGKTTTLKVIAGVTYPTRGSVKVRGRLAALIDVVVGFHPELTGRENVYLLGSVHGLTRKEMNARLDQIIDFAEIGQLMDTPLKRYSSGMISRLGFAVIANLDADILLVDEVLAVGDVNFQNKCIRWLDDYRSQGGTLVFVSHNLGLVRNMTERVVWLDHGRVVQDGPTSLVVPEYVRAMEQRTDDRAVGRSKGKALKAQKDMVARGLNRWGAGGARLETVHVSEPQMNGSDRPGLAISVSYEVKEMEEAVFCIGFVDERGNPVGAANSPTIVLPAESGTLECKIESLPFKSGLYFPVAAILSVDGTVEDHWKMERGLVIERSDGVTSNGFGPVEIQSAWSQ
jgi:ABC-type polysaccharide/polyol phosphate transport system ATPase subunit